MFFLFVPCMYQRSLHIVFEHTHSNYFGHKRWVKSDKRLCSSYFFYSRHRLLSMLLVSFNTVDLWLTEHCQIAKVFICVALFMSKQLLYVFSDTNKLRKTCSVEGHFLMYFALKGNLDLRFVLFYILNSSCFTQSKNCMCMFIPHTRLLHIAKFLNNLKQQILVSRTMQGIYVSHSYILMVYRLWVKHIVTAH